MSARGPARAVLGPLSVLLALLLAGCSTVPTNSPTVEITQIAEPPADVGIEALPPERGASPEEIVRGFIDAMASTTRNHPVARQFLTKAAAETWSDADGVTVISANYAPVSTAKGVVELTAKLVGTVDTQGVFTVSTGQAFTRTLTLEQMDEQWRIADPPDGLVQLEPDFARTYDLVNAYFLDPSGTRVVPDPRFLVSGDAQATALVDRLLSGPSTGVAAGVANPLVMAELRSNVTIQRQVATVDLTGVPQTSLDDPSALSAQLVWSLDQLPDVRAVRVLVDGQPVDVRGVPEVQTVDDWAALDPDAVPVESVGHYLQGGALLTVTAGEPAPGPAGTGAYALRSAVVTADARTNQLSFLVGVSEAGGVATLLQGPYGGDLAPVLTAGSFTDPTTAATRAEVWTVRDGTEVIRIPASGAPQTVNATTLAEQGPATVFQLSPDGVRAALVAQGPEGGQLLVGTVVRSDDQVAVRDLRAVAPSLSQVVDVAWRTAGSLLVLAGDARAENTVPYTVGVDGWGLSSVTTSGLPSQPTAVAAAPSRLPLVVAGGTLWQLAGGTWGSLVRGAEPLPGLAPFYPL